ncbi:hypothetical protein V8E54_009471, partial [Elaphomyces granulatus]
MESLTSRPAEELIQKQVDRFEKKAQSTLSARTKVQLRPNNYTEWHESFLVDAEAIKARDILDERQQKPPAGLSNLDTAIWHAKYDVLLRHLLSTLSPSILQGLQMIDRTNLFDILDHYKAEYGISPAKERLGLVKALKELTIQDGDYRNVLFKFRKIMQRLQTMEISADDLFHDLFIITIKDYNKLYVDSQLDDYFAANRTMPINNMDLRNNEISTRGTNQRGSTRGRAYRGRSGRGDTASSNNIKCSYCGTRGHQHDDCIYKHPEKQSAEWRKK